jgi:hypothetical protein
MWRVAMICAAVLGLGSPALAHPHVFIDTTVTAILDDQGRLTGLRLRWDYDALVSMVVAGDRGADADGDGAISASEAAVLDGFDMTWVEGFDGDTTLYQGDAVLPLEPGPRDWVTGWAEDSDGSSDGTSDGGHLWSEHTRWLKAPVDPGAGPVSIVVYDISDYTAYALIGAGLDPGDGASGCRIEAPDAALSAADGGLLSTVGLFLFGQEEASVDAGAPSAARGRVVTVLTCR